jgi:hypothetical protein
MKTYYWLRSTVIVLSLTFVIGVLFSSCKDENIADVYNEGKTQNDELSQNYAGMFTKLYILIAICKI